MGKWLIYICIDNNTPYSDKAFIGDAENIEEVRRFAESYLITLYGQSDEIEHYEHPTFAQYRHPQSAAKSQSRVDIIAGLVQEGEKLITSPSEFISKVIGE